MIQTKNISFQYDKRGEVFHFPDIVLKKEEHLLILGKSGIGKTTLLHLMAGLLRPKTGKIIVEGRDLTGLSNRQLDRFSGPNMGLVFQQNLAIRSLNVVENLQARLFFSQKKSDSTVLFHLLEQLNLSENKYQKPNELSEGQLQRLGIAAAVVHSPKVIFSTFWRAIIRTSKVKYSADRV